MSMSPLVHTQDTNFNERLYLLSLTLLVLIIASTDLHVIYFTNLSINVKSIISITINWSEFRFGANSGVLQKRKSYPG